MTDSAFKSGEPIENQDAPEVSELQNYQTRLLELEGLTAQKEKELGLASTRITELERVVSERDSTVAALKQSITESEEKLVEADSSLSQAVDSYQALAISTNPAVPAELVTGETIGAINDSLEKAKALVGKVKQELEAEIASIRVPAGAPQRMPLDLSALSSREKIKYAIGGRR